MKKNREQLLMDSINRKTVSKKMYLLSLLPVLLMMILIFSFSAKTATESDGTSSVIARKVLKVIEMVRGDIADGQMDAALATINHIVRKTAHATEYAILAILVANHLRVILVPIRRLFWYTVPLCALYAASDEFHQLFVEGRSGRFTDVCIDTAGAAAGTLLFMLLLYFLKRWNEKDQDDMIIRRKTVLR